MTYASGIGNSAAGGAAQAGRTGRHEASSVKVLLSMQILKYRDVRGSYSFTIATRLRSPTAQVWAHASSFAGVNRELWPLARMTFPPARVGKVVSLS